MSEEVAVSMKEKKVNGFDEWEVKDAVRTLQRAEEIKADAKLMEAIGPYIKKEKEAMDKVAKSIKSRKDLRDRASELEAKGM